MNSIPKISARTGVSKDAMLAALDREIRVAQRQTKGAAKGGWISKMQYDSQMLVAVLNWAWDMRVAQLNEEVVGHLWCADKGRHADAPSSSLNSNGDGHCRIADTVGRVNEATPLLLNEDDVGPSTLARKGHGACAPSSSPNGDGVGHAGNAAQVSHGTSAAPSPTHRDTDGHVVGAVNGPLPSAVPYREPSSAELKGRLSAKFRVAERILTSLDTYAINGKPIGDLSFAEARAALDDKIEHTAVLRQVLRHAANVSPNQLVREIVKPTDLDEMIRKAKELVDVA